MNILPNRSKELLVSVILVWAGYWPDCSFADDVLRPIDASTKLTVGIEDLVPDYPNAVRYQLVNVDADFLLAMLALGKKSLSVQDEASIDLALFGDGNLELKLEEVSQSADGFWVEGLFVSSARVEHCGRVERGKIEILVALDGRVWANIFWDKCKIGLIPIDSGRVHLLSQWND